MFEVAGNGTDTVLASVSYTLTAGQEVENLRTTNAAGLGAINLTGNSFAQSIAGNAGNNVLNGKLGSDTLNGGNGQDSFVFDTALGAANVDTILTFITADDTIVLENAIFAALGVGALAAGAFNTGAAATQPTTASSSTASARRCSTMQTAWAAQRPFSSPPSPISAASCRQQTSASSEAGTKQSERKRACFPARSRPSSVLMAAMARRAVRTGWPARARCSRSSLEIIGPESSRPFRPVGLMPHGGRRGGYLPRCSFSNPFQEAREQALTVPGNWPLMLTMG